METTQGVWILYIFVLILNFLVTDRQETAAGRHGFEILTKYTKINIFKTP